MRGKSLTCRKWVALCVGGASLKAADFLGIIAGITAVALTTSRDPLLTRRPASFDHKKDEDVWGVRSSLSYDSVDVLDLRSGGCQPHGDARHHVCAGLPPHRNRFDPRSLHGVDAEKHRPISRCAKRRAPPTSCARAIQQMRQGAAGFNPFIVIIVTAWEEEHRADQQGGFQRRRRSLAAPFSTAQLGTRIESHVDRRKNFVDHHRLCRPRPPQGWQPGLQRRTVRAAQFAQDEGQGQDVRRGHRPQTGYRTEVGARKADQRKNCAAIPSRSASCGG